MTTQGFDIEVPQFQMMTENIAPEGQPPFLVAKMLITTSGTMCQFFMGGEGYGQHFNYKSVAGSFREMIMRAGAEMTSKASGLIQVKELPDGLRKAQGR